MQRINVPENVKLAPVTVSADDIQTALDELSVAAHMHNAGNHGAITTCHKIVFTIFQTTGLIPK